MARSKEPASAKKLGENKVKRGRNENKKESRGRSEIIFEVRKGRSAKKAGLRSVQK
ncbi:hypothetical protein [Methanosarcina sp. KYL-1]|uniref:hypothetical protein n=1 Tax=Methanosarcina sp. KYL-1 TaxID=2602068 RepID=UPI00210145B2|nr:hypothetical protein [Methanosarcina sp. KYL-1]